MATSDFIAPIPGMSLAAEPGSRPWEQPPQYTSVKEVVEVYTQQLTNVDRMAQIADILRRGVPIDIIVESMIVYGMMQGKHTIDAGMVASPVLVELIITIAEMYGVDYVVSADDAIEEPVLTEEEAVQLVKDTEAKMSAAVAKKQSGAKGLMAKGE